MTSLIKCPHCGGEFELTEALSHQIGEELLSKERTRHRQELDKVSQEISNKARVEAQADFSKQLKLLKENEEAERKRSVELTDQVANLMKELRVARRSQEESKLEYEKKLTQEEGKIREQAQKQALAEHELKSKEKDKVIADLQKSLAEATLKAQQGSQQTQGEVLELEIEDLLKKEFPSDQISEVKKGVRGADVTQIVVDKLGRSCGTILWESKNAAWSNAWIAKFKEDARSAKAHLAVLVATHPPEHIASFAYLEGVWVVKRGMVTALATALRYNLISLHAQSLTQIGKQEKTELLYSYVTSHEFRGRVEAIVEAFSGMQLELEKEKRYFNSKWSRQEKQIRAVIDQTQGMYADMQGLVGRALPDIAVKEIEG